MSDKNEDALRMESAEDEITEKGKEVVEDDGRTVADMSGIEGHASFLGSVIGLRGDRKRRREITDELGIRRKGANGDVYVGRLRLRQAVAGKNFVIADILGDWQQVPAEPGDVVFAE